MPHEATLIPDESALLCEGCGYTLSGLPQTGNCPECGRPIEQSVGQVRHLAAFERNRSVGEFVETTTDLIVRPTKFYRTLSTRVTTAAEVRFEQLHRGLAAALFALVALGHYSWMFGDSISFTTASPLIHLAAFLIASAFLYLLMYLITRLATWLSAIESRYWGMRLPYAVVQRGLAFHAANYLPVALLTAIYVWTYHTLTYEGWLSREYDAIYLYTLCGLVIVAAGYLFKTYWIAMRNMMYANR